MKQRQSIRSFKRDPIDRELVEEIVACGAYAPTHNAGLRAIVVDEAEIIEAFDAILLRFIARLYKVLFRPRFVGVLAGLIGQSREYMLAKPKIQAALARGEAFHHPPVMVFIVGNKGMPLMVASAQYALGNTILYAQAQGLGSCLWGNGPIFMSRSREARRLLAMRRRERIYCALLLGYPAMRFRNKVEGKKLPVCWNGE